MTDKDFQHPVNKLFISACKALAREFCDTLGVSDHPADAWWVDFGGTFSFQCAEYFIDSSDMMRVIETRMTWEEFAEWYGYWAENEGKISLRSWLIGARPETLNNKSEQL